MAENDLDPMALSILSYFVRNPCAADSVEGLARWRLLSQTVHRTIAETKSAVQRLLSLGYLVEVSAPAAGTVFRLNETQLAQAQVALGAFEPGPP